MKTTWKDIYINFSYSKFQIKTEQIKSCDGKTRYLKKNTDIILSIDYSLISIKSQHAMQERMHEKGAEGANFSLGEHSPISANAMFWEYNRAFTQAWPLQSATNLNLIKSFWVLDASKECEQTSDYHRDFSKNTNLAILPFFMTYIWEQMNYSY